MKTAIMTDTNSAITVEEGKADGIFVLPMPVMIDGKGYLEGVDLTYPMFFEALAGGAEVSSSQPSPADLTGMWDQILAKGYDEIVYIPMTSGLSGACETAMQFAAEYDGRVQVVDNHRISYTLMNSVYDAKVYADEGKTAAEIRTLLEENAWESSIYITVNSLKYLIRSGRVTAAGATIADALQLKPILQIQGEKLDAFSKGRGMKNAERKMMDAIHHDLKTRFAGVPKENLSIGTAGTFLRAEDAEAWRQEVQREFPEYVVYYKPLSCSIGCHVGVGAAGTAVTKVFNRRHNS